jgi:serine/threonine protein kinase
LFDLFIIIFLVTLKEKIGKGSFGDVYVGKRIVISPSSSSSEQKAETEEEVAIKAVQLSSCCDNKGRVRGEILLKKLGSISPYLVKYKDFIIDGISLFIVMEYCEKGDLRQLIDMLKKYDFFIPEEVLLLLKLLFLFYFFIFPLVLYFYLCFSIKHVWKILSELIFGLVILKENNILHRDIKDGNIFVDKNNDVKLGVYFSFFFFTFDVKETSVFLDNLK